MTHDDFKRLEKGDKIVDGDTVICDVDGSPDVMGRVRVISLQNGGVWYQDFRSIRNVARLARAAMGSNG